MSKKRKTARGKIDAIGTMDSPVPRSEALHVLRHGRQLLACFDRRLDDFEETNEVFNALKLSLHEAGLVMRDFDGVSFDKGPMVLLFTPGLASLVARAANLMTLRMFMHTLVHGHRATPGGNGYPYFDQAYASGGWRALLERLEQFCDLASRHGWENLQDHPDIDLIRPVGF